MARRLFARSIVFVQALDQIRPALGRRLLHKGVKIALKRAPETPRRIHGPSAHDGARSWDVLWRKNAKCSERFRTARPARDWSARASRAGDGLLCRRNFCAPCKSARQNPESPGASAHHRRAPTPRVDRRLALADGAAYAKRSSSSASVCIDATAGRSLCARVPCFTHPCSAWRAPGSDPA